MRTFENLVLRWTLGNQNTITLADYTKPGEYLDFLWLSKLSVLSFQKWFPGARCVVMYNGTGFDVFYSAWNSIKPDLLQTVEIIDQCESLKQGYIQNKYHYSPKGVWWKWLPFRIDITKDEIAVDTDILCISKPTTWYDWLDGKTEILVAPERYEYVKVNTCGDLHNHPILRGKRPANCGVVGQRAGNNFEQQFFDITKQVRFGDTHDSLFITEQGVVNLWIYSLDLEKVRHTMLDFYKNAWIRDFIYLIQSGHQIETIHAVSWHKRIIRGLAEIFERRINSPEEYELTSMVDDILSASLKLNTLGREVLYRQLEKGFSATEMFVIHT